VFSVLAFAENKKELDDLEKKFIAEKAEYNLTTGGDGTLGLKHNLVTRARHVGATKRLLAQPGWKEKRTVAMLAADSWRQSRIAGGKTRSGSLAWHEAQKRAGLARVNNPVFRAAIRAASLRPDYKTKQVQNMTKVWAFRQVMLGGYFGA
jgi:hypothetical protein